MKLIAELCIILVFFIAYHFQGIYVAIAAAMALYTVQIIIQLIRKKSITRLELITYLSIVVLGGMSLLFRNELFFKWKPSVIYCLLSMGILTTRLWTKAPTLEKLLGSTLTLPQKVWSQLDYLWCAFLVTLAVLNLVIAYTLSTDLWVYFKLFGTLSLLFVFIMLQVWWLSPHLKSGEPK